MRPDMVCITASNPIAKNVALEDGSLRLAIPSDMVLWALLERLALQNLPTGMQLAH